MHKIMAISFLLGILPFLPEYAKELRFVETTCQVENVIQLGEKPCCYSILLGPPPEAFHGFLFWGSWTSRIID